jgi:2-methylcitrate dehydratase
MASRRRQRPDQVLVDIADYVVDYRVRSPLAYETARYCLIDALGCALEALEYPACTKLLGPIVEGPVMPDGARVPGTNYRLDPVQAAFNIGAAIRWLDFNDTWLAAEWGHPSDNLGAILAVADWQARQAAARGASAPLMRHVLTALIKAYEIQGCIALENAFNRVGLDHVLLVRIASTAVVAQLLGLTRAQIVDALSLAFADGGALRTYRHAPNTGSRKSWAAGDAAARAVRLALLVKRGEMGYPTVLSTRQWGFYDVVTDGAPLKLPRKYASYVVENILFKIAFPAEFHAQTAVECGFEVHRRLAALGKNPADVASIVIETQEACLRIIDKPGLLTNPADRDHCIQYMVAVAIIFGRLTASDYEDDVAADPRIDRLRARMTCVENAEFTRDYYDQEMRSIANRLKVSFVDGTTLDPITCRYPIGHRRRRREGIPLLEAKFRKNVARRFSGSRRDAILDASLDQQTLEAMAVNDYIDLYATKRLLPARAPVSHH